jgi:hypothetical protein
VIDANDIERMAKERPDECFLKGSGILKLTGAIHELERQNAELERQIAASADKTAATVQPVAPSEDSYIICGVNPTPIDADLIGCGKPIIRPEDVYRCTDCEIPFHRECAKQHFATDTPEHATKVFEEQLRRLDSSAAPQAAQTDDSRDAARWRTAETAFEHGLNVKTEVGNVSVKLGKGNLRAAIDAALAQAGKEKPVAWYEKPLTRCAASRGDGECFHTQCPQLRDGEPKKSGRHCPLDTREDGDE